MSRDGGGALVLGAKDCKTLLRQEKALCDWKKKAEPGFVIPLDIQSATEKRCQKTKAGTFRISVSKCLPELAKRYPHRKLARSGPNCWGTAMSFNGLFEKPRFMWPEEMLYWLESPRCRKLQKGEVLEPGDLINVFAPEYILNEDRNVADPGTQMWDALYPGRQTALVIDESPYPNPYTGYHWLLHSETYVTPELAFGKDSPAHDDPFYFHPLENAYGRPRSSNKACQENQKLAPHLREYQKSPKKIDHTECAYFSLAYRCDDIEGYFSSQKLSPQNQEIWESVQSLKAMQDKLFGLVTSETKMLTRCEVVALLGIADAAAATAREELKSAGADKTREMLLVAEFFAAAAIRESLRLARAPGIEGSP